MPCVYLTCIRRDVMFKKVIFGIALVALTGHAIASSKPYEPSVEPSRCVLGDSSKTSAVYSTYSKCLEPVQRGYANGIVVGVHLISNFPPTEPGYSRQYDSVVITPSKGYTAPKGFIIASFYSDSKNSAHWVK